jgi:ribonuclease P protein component
VAKRFSLAKGERLKSRKLIDQLFSEGKSFAAAPYRIYYLSIDKEALGRSVFNIQFGVGVSGRNFKKAVDRNRIKRLTREAYRLQKAELKEILSANNRHLNLFVIYTAKELPIFDTVKEKVKLILDRLIKIINENNSSNS